MTDEEEPEHLAGTLLGDIEIVRRLRQRGPFRYQIQYEEGEEPTEILTCEKEEDLEYIARELEGGRKVIIKLPRARKH